MSATLRASDDLIKRDLELTCNDCGEILCDAESGDTPLVLLEVEIAHAYVCPKGAPFDN
jgi:hypothetical protein